MIREDAHNFGLGAPSRIGEWCLFVCKNQLVLYLRRIYRRSAVALATSPVDPCLC
jgi:hypothetical protein